MTIALLGKDLLLKFSTSYSSDIRQRGAWALYWQATKSWMPEFEKDGFRVLLLFYYLNQCYQHFHGFLHIPHPYPFMPAMYGLHAGK